MKPTIPYISFLLLLLFFYACGDGGMRHRLVEIDSYAWQHPDSALNELETIDPIGLNREDRAYHALLVTQSRYRSGIEETDDSLIDIAVSYYDGNLEDRNRARAYYYKGIIGRFAGDYGSSLVSFLNAEKSAVLAKDSLLQALAYRGLGDVGGDLKDFRYSLENYKSSYRLFSLIDNQIYKDWALADIAKSYYNINQVDSSASIALGLIAKLGNENTDLQKYCYTLVTKCLLEEGKYEEAIKIINNNEDKTSHLSPEEYSIIGELYLRTDNPVKAKEYLDSALCNDGNAYYLSYLINLYEGNYKEALINYEKEMTLFDAEYEEWATKDFVRGIIYNYELNQQLKEQKEEERRNQIILISIILAILITAAVIIVGMTVKNKNKELLNQKETMGMLRDELEHTKKILYSAETSVISGNTDDPSTFVMTFPNQLDMLDKLIVSYYEMQESPDIRKNLYEEIINLISKMGKDKKFLKFMEKSLNESLNGIIKDLKRDLPELKDDDIRLFIYIILKFSGKSMSVFLNLNVDNIYVKKSQLKKKIEALEVVEKDKYLRFF